MSIKTMMWVWESDLPPIERLVALAYADHADQDGGNIYPSLSTVAKKVGMDRANIVRIRRRLIEKGVMVQTRATDHRPTCFRMDQSALLASVTETAGEDVEPCLLGTAPSVTKTADECERPSVTGTAPSVTRPLGLVSQGQPSSVPVTPKPSLTINTNVSEPFSLSTSPQHPLAPCII